MEWLNKYKRISSGFFFCIKYLVLFLLITCGNKGLGFPDSLALQKTGNALSDYQTRNSIFNKYLQGKKILFNDQKGYFYPAYYTGLKFENFNELNSFYGILKSDKNNFINTGPPPVNFDLSFNNLFYKEQDSSAVTVSFNTTGGNYKVMIRHKGILDEVFGATKTLTSNAGGDYVFMIKPGMLDSLGVHFKVGVISGNDTTSKEGKIYRAFNAQNSPVIPFERFGGTKSSWNMFSIPYELDNKSIQKIFENYVPSNYSKTWRVMSYHKKTQEYIDIDDGSVEVGVGYWFNAKDSFKIQVGAGEVYSTIPFTLQLDQGWNMIGNPYNVPLSWQEILADNGNPEGVGDLQVFNVLNQSTTDILRPFKGAFVWADKSLNLDIIPRKPSSNARIAGDQKENYSHYKGPGNWKMYFDLKFNDKKMRLGGFGMHPGASELKDAHDAMAVPRFMHYTDLFTKREQYFYPRFATDVVPSSKGYHWEFTLASNSIKDGAQLVWNNKLLAQSEGNWYLVDKATGHFIDMQEMGHYQVNLIREEFEFEIYYSRQGGALVPERVILGNAYPNPSGLKTVLPIAIPDEIGKQEIKLSVYNQQGQLVEVIAEGRFSTGLHKFEWDLAGKGIPSGVYIYRLMFQNSDLKPLQKKIIVP